MWSPQQEDALKAIKKWVKNPRQQVFRLFGYAGAGKSTLAREVENLVRGRVIYGAFTGKAALVLRRKGCHGASTIHSMIYTAEEDPRTHEPIFVLSPLSDVAKAKLVVIDECGMVDSELGVDLLSFGTKVLVLGDPAQLAPIKGAGYFTAHRPDFMLTEVHRQARDNPIIAMSMIVREGRQLDYGSYGDSGVVTKASINADAIMGADQSLVGLNRTRMSHNRRFRELLGRENEMPEVGDKLVCLKNNREKRLLNGGLWTVLEVAAKNYDTVSLYVESEDDGAIVEVRVKREFFTGQDANLTYKEKIGTDEFAYGYALTVHKAQGSQWPNVMVFDESGAFRDQKANHLYTAITRASEKVTVIR